MGDGFDPYYKWLGIPAKDQPPHHYRLLGLELLESDPDVIESAADRTMAHLRSLQIGAHGAHSQQLLNEVAAAKRCLLDPRRKSSYDEALANSRPLAPPAVNERPTRPNVTNVAPVAPSPTVPIVSAVALKQDSTSRLATAIRPTPARPLWREPVVAVAAIVGLVAGLLMVFTVLLPAHRHAAMQSENVAVSLVQPATMDQRRTRGPPPKEMPNAGAKAPPIIAADEAQRQASPRRPPSEIARDVATENIEPKAASATQTVPVDRPTAALRPNTNGDLPSQRPPTTGVRPVGDPTGAAHDLPRIRYDLIGEPINVLKTIDPARDAVSGNWSFEGDELVSPQNVAWARLRLPVAVPEEYILTVEATTRGRGHTLNLGLVGGGSQFIYCSGASQRGGLFLLDGKEWHTNETSHPVQGLFRVDSSNTVMCLVHKKGVIGQINHRTVMDWEGDFKRLSLQPPWRIPSTESLFLGTWPQYRYTKVELQAIHSQATFATEMRDR